MGETTQQTTLPLEGGGHTVEEVLASLRRLRIEHVIYEVDLQAQISEQLTKDSIVHQREVKLGPHSRIDFLVAGGVGIEVKKSKPDFDALARQADRYAAFDQLKAIILVAERGVFDHPDQLHGKPVRYLSLSKLWGIAL